MGLQRAVIVVLRGSSPAGKRLLGSILRERVQLTSADPDVGNLPATRVAPVPTACHFFSSFVFEALHQGHTLVADFLTPRPRHEAQGRPSARGLAFVCSFCPRCPQQSGTLRFNKLDLCWHLSKKIVHLGSVQCDIGIPSSNAPKTITVQWLLLRHFALGSISNPHRRIQSS